MILYLFVFGASCLFTGVGFGFLIGRRAVPSDELPDVAELVLVGEDDEGVICPRCDLWFLISKGEATP